MILLLMAGGAVVAMKIERRIGDRTWKLTQSVLSRLAPSSVCGSSTTRLPVGEPVIEHVSCFERKGAISKDTRLAVLV